MLNIGEGWRSQVPQPGGPDLAGNFVKAFIGTREHEKDRTESKRRYDQEFDESKRRFDILNPALPLPAQAPPTATSTNGVSLPTMMSQNAQPEYDGLGAMGFSWDGKKDSRPAWMRDGVSLDSPTQVFDAIRRSSHVNDALAVEQEASRRHPEWFVNKTFNAMKNEAFKTPMAADATKFKAEQAKIAMQRAENATIGARYMGDMAAKFNTQLNELSKIDDVAAQRIMEMPDFNHEVLGPIPSAAKRQALATALRASRQLQEADAAKRAADAIAGGMTQTGETIKTPTGTMTFKTPDTGGGGEPVSITEPDGTKIFYRPGGTGMHVVSPKGETKEPSAAQLFSMGSRLLELGGDAFKQDGTNMLNRAIERARGTKVAPTAQPAATPPPAATNAPALPSGETIASQFDEWLKRQQK